MSYAIFIQARNGRWGCIASSATKEGLPLRFLPAIVLLDAVDMEYDTNGIMPNGCAILDGVGWKHLYVYSDVCDYFIESAFLEAQDD